MSDLSANAGGVPAGAPQPNQPAPWGPTPGDPYQNPGAAPYQYGPGAMPPVVAPPKKKLSPRTIISLVVVAVIVIGAIVWVASGNVSAKNIKVGACFTDTAGDTVSTIKTVNCSKPHDSEVFLNQVITDVSTYPSDSDWDGLAQQYCLPAFASYVGTDYNNSTLNIGYYYPDSTGWGQGDKTLTCYATDPNGGLTATIKGSQK